MKSFPEKVFDARSALAISQRELAKRTGVSLRMILAYEKGEKYPRATTLKKLAEALQVSVKFLSDDSCEDPFADIEKDNYIDSARKQYENEDTTKTEQLLTECRSLFVSKEFSMDQKQAFFDAITEAYISCKKEANEKFNPYRSFQ